MPPQHLNAARLDFWEAQYLCGEYRLRRNAKKVAKKARRRVNKALIREALAA